MVPKGLVENLPGVIYRCRSDIDWTMDYISEAVEPLSGYQPADFIERRIAFADLIHPADRAQVSRNILYAVANNEPFDIEYRIYHADGTRRWVLEHGRPVYGEDGLVQYLDGVIVDVTRTRLAEAALRAGEERFRHLAEHATDLVCRYNPDGVCLYASPSAVTITGYKPNELIGRSAYDFIHPDDVESSAAAHVKVLMTDARETVTYRFRRKDGVWIWMESVIQATRDGETHALIDLNASSRDITERRGVEDALRRELAARIAAEHALGHALSLVEAVLNTVPEGVVATDPSGQIVRSNDSFQRLFALPDEVLASRSMTACLEHVSVLAADPGAYRREWIYAGIGERDEHAAVVPLADGRKIEQMMQVRRANGVIVGRVWTFSELPVPAVAGTP